MARVIRSEAELSRVLAKPGYRIAQDFGGETVDTETIRGADSAISRGDACSNEPMKAPTKVEAPAYVGRDGQISLLELRRFPVLTLPMPPTVNEAWILVPYYDKEGDGKLKVRKVLTDEHRQFRSTVIGRVKGDMLRNELRDQPLLGRLEMVVMLFFANRRRTDVDNRVKPLQDALTHAGAYKDDSQIDELVVRRTIQSGPEACRVCLREISS
jgi:crossover junction endodeoxyribonuclease RusA